MLDISSTDYIKTILAFDYGDARIGIAKKPASQAEPEPLTTMLNDSQVWEGLEKIINKHQPNLAIVGRPRNLEGESTSQTVKSERFASELSRRYNIKVELQDEALTTQQAKERIPSKFKGSQRSVIDQYAACIILESYLAEK